MPETQYFLMSLVLFSSQKIVYFQEDDVIRKLAFVKVSYKRIEIHIVYKLKQYCQGKI